MSHIPNAAMPHAAPHEENDEADTSTSSFSERAGKLADRARANPKAAVAAGAALVAGAVAAAAIPIVRARKKTAGTTKTGAKKKTS